MKVLVVSEHHAGQLLDATWELIGASRSLSDSVVVALIGAGQDLASQLCIAGVKEVVCVPTQSPNYECDTQRHALETVIADVKPDVVLMPFSVNALESGPAVAAKVGFGLATDVFGLRAELGNLIATRGYYGGKVHADLTFQDEQAVLLLLRRGVWPQVREAGAPAIRVLQFCDDRRRTRHEEYVVPQSEGDTDIAKADFLLCVGRGIGEQDNLPRFESLAQKLGATLAVSRPIVDAGWMPRSRQVGQSGRTVKPKVYLSLGVSGAVQHIAGMKTSGVIVSVNKDAEASIFQVAHYGATVDLFDFADELEKQF